MTSSKFLINIPESERIAGRTPDSIKHNKDCADFVCLDDGTITKECRYCNLSEVCQQVDILPNGEKIDMLAHYVPVMDIDTGQILEWTLYCTGKHRTDDDPLIPEKAS